MATDGDRAQCHICGKWFRHLGNHVARRHFANCDDYRAQFGLRPSTGLIGPALVAQRRKSVKHLAKYVEQNTDELLRNHFARLPKAMQRERRSRPEWVNSPEYQHLQQAWKDAGRSPEAIAKGQATLRSNPKFREWISKGGKAGGAAMKERQADPEWKRQWASKIAARKQGPLVTCQCVMCGKKFETRSWERRQTCGSECRQARRVQATRVANVSARHDVRQRLSETAKKRDIQRDDYGRITGFKTNAVTS